MPFAIKPEVQIWRKPGKWTRNYRLPIRLQYNVWVYRAPFRGYKLLPVSVKPKVLKSDVGWSQNDSRYICEHLQSAFNLWQPLPAKPEVEIWQKSYSWTRNYRLRIRPQCNVWVYRAPFRCWKLLPVSAKSKVLKFHVHSVHKRFHIGLRAPGKCL